MTRTVRILGYAVAVFIGATAASCDDDGVGVVPGPVSIVEVTGPATAAVGDLIALTAVAKNAAGQVMTEARFTWRSSHPNSASVDGDGVVHISRSDAGLITITATSEGVNGAWGVVHP